MKTVWRTIKWLFLRVLGLLMIYGLLAFIFSWWSTNPPARDCTKDRTVYITTTGVHLDVVIPVEYLPANLQDTAHLDTATTHLAFGWGERNFYLETPSWDDLTVSNAAQALLVNSEPVMHLINYHKVNKEWKKIELCNVALEQMLAFIERSFRKNTDGNWIEIPATGYTERDFFYEANGQYNAINTCNTWLNNALKTAGVKTSRWSPLTYGILYHLE